MPSAQAKSQLLHAASHAKPKRISTFLMLLTSAFFMTLLFPPFYCVFLAPVALVPLVLCILRRPMRFLYLLAYWGFGILFFLPNLFWLAPVTFGGFIGLALFVALYFPLFALVLHRLVIHQRLPATLAVPLVWTAVEFLRAVFVLGGFPWFLLGNALAPLPNRAWFLTGVFSQSADIFGVWGLSCFLAMINGFVVDLLRLRLRPPHSRGRLNPVLVRLGAAVAMVFVANLGYGIFRLSENTTRPGPRVAVIQENIPQSLKDDRKHGDEVFLKHLQLTYQALQAKPRPDIIAWPETMVPAPINSELLSHQPDLFTTMEQLKAALARATDSDDFRQTMDDYDQALRDTTASSGVPLLVGYTAYIPRPKPLPAIIQNRTTLLVPDAKNMAVRAGEYSKIHLVPFGEYIPFRGVPGISQLMLLFSPVSYDYSNTPGDTWTRFTLNVPPSTDGRPLTTDHAYTFATPICFEDAMPEPARMMTAGQYGDGYKTDFLINVSNDGWFYGVELDQHLQACQIRAIENRIPIARSVNTGNSGFINSNGQITLLVTDPASGTSLGAVGTASQVMALDSRVSLYSRIGDLLPIVCGILSALLTGWTYVRPRRGK